MLNGYRRAAVKIKKLITLVKGKTETEGGPPKSSASSAARDSSELDLSASLLDLTFAATQNGRLVS